MPPPASVGPNQAKWSVFGILTSIFGVEPIALYADCDPLQPATVSVSLQRKRVGTFTSVPSGPHAASPTDVLKVGAFAEAKVVPPPPIEYPEVPNRSLNFPASGPLPTFCPFNSSIAATSLSPRKFGRSAAPVLVTTTAMPQDA